MVSEVLLGSTVSVLECVADGVIANVMVLVRMCVAVIEESEDSLWLSAFDIVHVCVSRVREASSVVDALEAFQVDDGVTVFERDAIAALWVGGRVDVNMCVIVCDNALLSDSLLSLPVGDADLLDVSRYVWREMTVCVARVTSVHDSDMSTVTLCVGDPLRDAVRDVDAASVGDPEPVATSVYVGEGMCVGVLALLRDAVRVLVLEADRDSDGFADTDCGVSVTDARVKGEYVLFSPVTDAPRLAVWLRSPAVTEADSDTLGVCERDSEALHGSDGVREYELLAEADLASDVVRVGVVLSSCDVETVPGDRLRCCVTEALSLGDAVRVAVEEISRDDVPDELPLLVADEVVVTVRGCDDDQVMKD